MDFIPEKSQIQAENILKHNDKTLYALIKELGVQKLVPKGERQVRGDNRRGGRREQ